MNILDEDIDAPQRAQLLAWKIHCRKIGVDIGHSGMKDRDDVIPLLHSLRRPTFFTQDHGFYHPSLRHLEYCLVYLDAFPDEAAAFIRRLLRHPAFRTQAARMGKVIRVHQSGLNYWQTGEPYERKLDW